MFVHGNSRVATTVPWQTVNSVDWPVKPYTAYFNGADELVWVTDDVALLAVRNGGHQSPINLMYNCGGLVCLIFSVISGLNKDGTTAASGTCNGWTSVQEVHDMNVDNRSTLAYAVNTAPCSNFEAAFPVFVLCVEQ